MTATAVRSFRHEKRTGTRGPHEGIIDGIERVTQGNWKGRTVIQPLSMNISVQRIPISVRRNCITGTTSTYRYMIKRSIRAEQLNTLNENMGLKPVSRQTRGLRNRQIKDDPLLFPLGHADYHGCFLAKNAHQEEPQSPCRGSYLESYRRA